MEWGEVLLKGWVPSDLACGRPSLAPAPPHREHWVLVPQTDQSPDEWLARGGKPARKLNAHGPCGPHAGTPVPHTASLCLAGLPEGRGRKVKPPSPSADGRVRCRPTRHEYLGRGGRPPARSSLWQRWARQGQDGKGEDATSVRGLLPPH